MLDNQEKDGQILQEKALDFNWRYILFPLVILLLSVAIVAWFYRLLPPEVAYHFASDGSPDRWLGRGAIILWMLLPQLFFTLLAAGISWGMTKLPSLFHQPAISGIRVGEVLSLMGNMVVLPQIILCFAMLDIFSYNSYQVRLMPLWGFTLIVMGLGGIVLGIFFIRAIRRVLAANQ